MQTDDNKKIYNIYNIIYIYNVVDLYQHFSA